jgi:hypothetical protein
VNRLKKESIKRHSQAREGLTPQEIAALDAREAADEEFEEAVQGMHFRLFPEEYDSICDDGADAELRRRGINPMAADYIDRTDARRAALGFAGYMAKNDPRPSDTLGWVRKMMREGGREKLERILAEQEVSYIRP